MDQNLTRSPLKRLCSIASLRQVQSPESEIKQQPKSLTQIQNQTDLMHTALDFSIDDLFAKIQRITSQYSFEKQNVLRQVDSNILQQPLHEEKSMNQKQCNFKSSSKIEHKSQNRTYQIKVFPPQTKKTEFKQIENIKPRNNKISIADFQLGNLIGSGKFGDVYQCRHKSTGSLFALKKIFKSTIQQYKMVDQLVSELKIHYSLDHPNIVKLYTHFCDQYHIFLLMEYLEGGILMNHIKSEERIVSNYLLHVFKGVEYLHQKNIAHRDIKPENIVLTNGVAKLCDFGWATNCDTGMKKTFCGTLDYVSPQILEQKIYGLGVDLWSLGILCFEMLTGFAPFKQDFTKFKIQRIKNFEQGTLLFPPYISVEARDIINRFLRKDPDDRLKIRQAYNHPFIKKYLEKQQAQFCEYRLQLNL